MRLTCEVETHFDVLPSATTKGSFSKQPKSKATLIVGKKESTTVSKRRKGSTNSPEADDFDNRNICLVVQTSKNPSGIQYKISNNIKKIYSKFIGEGKGTICFHNPPHTLALSKADPPQLKTVFNLLRIAMSPSGQVLAASNGTSLSVPAISADLSAKNGDIPKSRLRITSKSAYPLAGFPPTLEQLEATGINLTRIDIRICRLKNLTYLDLSNNKICGLPDSMKDCRLCELKLSGNDIEYFPPVICSGTFASTIKTLDLSRNHIKVLPNNISLLQQMIHLKIDCNDITFIPRNFGKLRKLKFFSASHNQIKVLPHSFSKLSLESVDLFGNPFQSTGMVSRCGSLNLPPLMELSARAIKKARIPYDATFVPVVLCHHLDLAKKCLCGNACFDVYIHHVASLSLHKVAATVTAVDRQGTVAVPVEMFLCKANCLKLWNHLV